MLNLWHLLALAGVLPVSVFAQAMPDCGVSQAGKVICLNEKKPQKISSIVEFNNDPHPATLKASQPVSRVRQEVQPISVDKFLPEYFEPRVIRNEP